MSDNGLSSNGVMPLNEEGVVSTMMGANMGVTSWANIQAYDELETNVKLIFPQSIYTYHSMRTDPQIQGLLTGAIWPLLRMKWYIKPNGAREEIVQHVSEDYNLPIGEDQPSVPYTPETTVQQVLTIPTQNAPPGTPAQAPQPGLSNVPTQLPPAAHPFNQRRTQNRFNFLDHLENALDAIAYGFEVFEQVGYIGKDGLFHYRKLATRPPQTITEFALEQDGGVKYIKQANFTDVELTIDRLVIYSFQRRGANWHGRSMLRGCYAPWLLKDRAMRVGVMNIQRAGVGTPIATGHPGASEGDLLALSQMMQKLVAGDRSGGAIPYGSTLKLVGVEGGQPDTVGFIKLMNEEMARSFFQMFMQLGQTTSGSRALGQTFVQYHKLVTEYLAQWFTLIFNEHVIEDDIEWNYGPDEEFAPLLAWEWDEGSSTNPEGQQAAQNPAQKMQQMVDKGEIQTNDQTKAVILG